MAFVKVVTNKSYYKRYQTKYRRRREGKTDYAQRRLLVKQDKNRYNSPKNRLVVRTTNTKIICQVVYATIQGDRVLVQANSSELPRYGVKVGLKNYAAAYCTGLLVARRLLKSLGMDSQFEGKKKADGEEFHMADNFEGDRRPFKALLDIGLVRTTVGARVFGAMKGAADGGLDVPHNTKLFPGTSKAEGKEAEYDAKVHRDHIYGKHVAKYMEQLKAEDEETYKKHFAEYIKAGLNAGNLEAAYTKAHAAIRASPDAQKSKKARYAPKRKDIKTIVTPKGKSYSRDKKKTLEQRKETVYAKIRAAQEKAAMAVDEDEE